MLIALAGFAIGGLWAFAKAVGGEVDICTDPGGGCTSGWYYAVPILLGSVLVGGLGVALVPRAPSEGRSAKVVQRVLVGVLVALPLLVTLVLVVTATAADPYYGDGRSYWNAHSEDGVQPLVGFAGLVNLAIAAALVVSVRKPPRLIALAGLPLVGVGFALGTLAWFALRTGH